jgi:hypothetical protein
MKETLTIEKVNFNLRTQALLNFTPISFMIKHKDIASTMRGETFEGPYWSEEAHRLLGKNVITMVDKDNKLWEIKIVNFPKEYDRLIQLLEGAGHLVPQQFNILEAGLVNVQFFNVLTWAFSKYIMPKKMGERTNY